VGAVVGERDEGGPAVVRMWGALDESGGFEPIDEAGDVARADPQFAGERSLVRRPHAVQACQQCGPAGLGIVGALGTAGLLGIPTDVIANPWFERKVPTRSFEVIVLVTLSLVAGAIAATCATPSTGDTGTRRAGVASGIVGWFAVSCPLCNPVVVGLLGASGATGAFAHLQPALGAVAVAFAAGALVLRVKAMRRGACRIDTRRSLLRAPVDR
jgi:hypothetical protein